MAFGKGFMAPNYSGEYALAAILNDKSSGDESNEEEAKADKKRLEEVCQSFEELRGKTPEVCYCLPSMILFVAKDFDLTTELYNLNLPILTEEAVEEEEEAMTDEVEAGEQTITNLLGDSKNTHFLLLVKSGKWIAVKRKSDGKRFDIYDPQKEGKEVFKSQEALEVKLTSFDYDVDDETLVITIVK